MAQNTSQQRHSAAALAGTTLFLAIARHAIYRAFPIISIPTVAASGSDVMLVAY
nr:hypothetical protein [Vibrio taketomensis]